MLLAAGRSTRFGDDDKLMADYRGKPLIVHALEAVASLPFGHLIAVVRPIADAPVIHRKLDRRGYALVVNDAPDEGLSGSIIAAVKHAAETDCRGVLLCLADMPHVPIGHLNRICMAAIDIRSVVASTDGLIATPPAFVGRKHFDQLLALRGDQGARALLNHGTLIETSSMILHDVDLPEDISRWGG